MQYFLLKEGMQCILLKTGMQYNNLLLGMQRKFVSSKYAIFFIKRGYAMYFIKNGYAIKNYLVSLKSMQHLFFDKVCNKILLCRKYAMFLRINSTHTYYVTFHDLDYLKYLISVQIYHISSIAGVFSNGFLTQVQLNIRLI
jgi:hypothetical protein